MIYSMFPCDFSFVIGIVPFKFILYNSNFILLTFSEELNQIKSSKIHIKGNKTILIQLVCFSKYKCFSEFNEGTLTEVYHLCLDFFFNAFTIKLSLPFLCSKKLNFSYKICSSENCSKLFFKT